SQSRIEREEKVDVAELFAGVCEHVRRMKSDPEWSSTTPPKATRGAARAASSARILSPSLLLRAQDALGLLGRERHTWLHRHSRRLRRGALARTHIDATVEERTVDESDARREDVAGNAPRRIDDDGLAAVQVAFDRAVDDDDARVDVALDDALVADRHALRVIDRAFDPALQDEILVGTELALEPQRGAEHRDAASRGCRRLCGRLCARRAAERPLRDRLLALLESEVTHERSPFHCPRLFDLAAGWPLFLVSPSPFFMSMSIVPLKCEPSTSDTDGAWMLPRRLPDSATKTERSACRSPSTAPSTLMICARMFALTLPSSHTVTRCV